MTVTPIRKLLVANRAGNLGTTNLGVGSTLGVAGTTGDGSGTASLGLTVVPSGAATTDVAGNALASASVSGANETFLLTATAPATIASSSAQAATPIVFLS